MGKAEHLGSSVRRQWIHWDRCTQELGCGGAPRMAFGPWCPLWVVQVGSLVVGELLCGIGVMVWGQRALKTRGSLSSGPHVLLAWLWEGHPHRACVTQDILPF